MRQRRVKRKILGLLSLILFPIIILLLIYNFYSIHVYNSKIVQSNYMSLFMYKNNMQKNLLSIDHFLAETVGNDYRVHRLMGGEGELEAYGDSWEITELLKSNLSMQQLVAGYILVSNKNQIVRTAFTGDIRYETQLEIRRQIKECIEGKQEVKDNEWKALEACGRALLFHALGNKDTYIAAVVDLEKCIPSELLPEGHVSWFTFCRRDDVPLLDNDLLKEYSIELHYEQNDVEYSGRPKYMIIGEMIENTDVSLKMITANSGYMSNLNPVQILLLAISLLAVLIVPLSFYGMDKLIVYPLQQLSRTMESIRNGNLDDKMEDDFGIVEYRTMIDTFNSMMQQIKKARIEVYENEIEKKHAQLQYLQLQIHPHFYLNCLKMLYAMVECQEYDKFREMIMSISNHIRYTFKDNMTMVPLQVELEHVKNYIRIQQLSTNLPIDHRIRIEPELLDFKVPTLMLETFVENSFKYGRRQETALKLTIDGALSEDGKKLVIHIADNGAGFPDDLLDRLNKKEEEIYRDTCVGIGNVKYRLELLYGKHASIHFQNLTQGAAVNICFTLDEE